jgi:hypothetical protein
MHCTGHARVSARARRAAGLLASYDTRLVSAAQALGIPLAEL